MNGRISWWVYFSYFSFLIPLPSSVLRIMFDEVFMIIPFHCITCNPTRLSGQRADIIVQEWWKIHHLSKKNLKKGVINWRSHSLSQTMPPHQMTTPQKTQNHSSQQEGCSPKFSNYPMANGTQTLANNTIRELAHNVCQSTKDIHYNIFNIGANSLISIPKFEDAGYIAIMI